MTEDELRKWFDELQRMIPRSGRHIANGISDEAARFLPEAESALRTAFPGEHPLCVAWTRAHSDAFDVNRSRPGAGDVAWARLVGIFDSAHAQLKAGRRGSFVSTVRRAAEEDMLGVAEALIDEGYRAASAVTAGGALEVHLRGLCVRAGIQWAGKDQIENYKAALEREHKTDATKGIGTSDAKSVTAWGGLRNDAAHKPDEFIKTRTEAEIRVLIESIRQFIARTT